MANDDKTKDAPELPFSHETLMLFQQLQRATSKEERTRLTIELATRFAAEHDSSDASATDDYHVYFEEFEKARLAYQQSAMKVGRLATACIQHFLDAGPSTIEDLTTVREVAARSMN